VVAGDREGVDEVAVARGDVAHIARAVLFLDVELDHDGGRFGHGPEVGEEVVAQARVHDVEPADAAGVDEVEDEARERLAGEELGQDPHLVGVGLDLGDPAVVRGLGGGQGGREAGAVEPAEPVDRPLVRAAEVDPRGEVEQGCARGRGHGAAC
jgi:hypothetical protein